MNCCHGYRWESLVQMSEASRQIAAGNFSARVEALMNRYEAFSDELIGILHRVAHARKP